MTRLAIVGGGIAGLGLAYYLRDQYDVTIYEKDDYSGGHANTATVLEGQREIAIDTGFMVFNHQTYPLLVDLFKQLDVPTKKTDMSFSVQEKIHNIEYAGASFDRLFGDRSNILNGRFWKMILEIDRFNKEGEKGLSEADICALSIGQYVQKHKYNDDFVNWYLLPMGAALWSTPPHKMMSFPALTLLRFFRNHGLLGTNHHQWWTVDGGSKEYVERLVARLKHIPRIRSEVAEVRRSARSVRIVTCSGGINQYDMVVLACHADQALQILRDPSPEEERILGAFSYQLNDTILHTDRAVMPQHKPCWASWNFRSDARGPSTHYWMNSLQNVSQNTDYFVTLNGEHLVDQSKILKRYTYHHPIFDLNALQAQTKLTALNENSLRHQVFFCGSYFGYGFHEDALASSAKLAELLTERVLCH